jgi:thiamine-phosphate pyrophosphorylase
LHLLLGLIDEEEGRAAQLLTRGGVEIASVREQLVAIDEHGPAIATIIAEARVIARNTGSPGTISSEHVLHVVLETSPAIRATLTDAGYCDGSAGPTTAAIDGVAIQLDEPLEFADPIEYVTTHRALDANANRSREALRAIEDYCRFHLNDTFLCREWKVLRHDLASVFDAHGSSSWLAARDTRGDVGTAITTDQERNRVSPRHVAEANAKRLQEALRSLEEFGKVINADLGRAFETLRYRSYTLEQATLLGTSSRQRLASVRLCFLVTAARCVTDLEWAIQEAITGGVDMIQMREKDKPDRELMEFALRIRRLTDRTRTIFIVNDRPDIARLAGADGVHLGQDDLTIHAARRIVGNDALIGVSTHNVNQLHQAIRDGASYVGIGPVFPSETKAFADLAGLQFVRDAMAETTVPAFAIGGITLENLPQLVAAGANRVAVSSALCQADEPQPVAAALRGMLPR